MATTPIHELPNEVWTLARGYAKGDEQEVLAILLRNFERRPFREIEQKTGVEFSQIKRLSKGFSELCDAQRERRVDAKPEAA